MPAMRKLESHLGSADGRSHLGHRVYGQAVVFGRGRAGFECPAAWRQMLRDGRAQQHYDNCPVVIAPEVAF